MAECTFVKAHSSHSPTDDTTKLSTIDQISPRIYHDRVLCFRTDQTQSPSQHFSTLVQALSHALDTLPFLCGRVTWKDEARKELQISHSADDSVPFHFRDFTSAPAKDDWTFGSFAELGAKRFPISTIPTSKLSPRIAAMPTPTEGKPCMYLQANFIEGGLLLTYAFHHCVVDLVGISTLLNLLASHTATLSEGRNVQPSSLPPRAFDRSVLSHGTSNVDASEFPDTILDIGKDHPRRDAVVTCVWRVSAEAQAKLKSLVAETLSRSPRAAQEKALPIYTNDVLCALLWLHVSRARRLRGKGHASSKLFVACDIRPGMKPPMDPNYLGNAVFLVDTSRATLEDDAAVTAEEFAAAAQSLRLALKRYDYSTMDRHVGHIENATNFADVQIRRDSYFGPDLVVSNQSRPRYYDQEWGSGLGGRVKSVRLLADYKEGMSTIQSRLPDGGFEMSTVLGKEATRRLCEDEGFTKYAKLVCTS